MKKFVPLIAGALCVGSFSANAESKVDFKKDIVPILQKSCLECHGEAKQKGDLRLDTKESALKSGKDAVIVANDAEKSELYRRIILPKGHDDVMPPKGEPLSKEQTELLKNWIAQGANWPDGEVIKAADSAVAAAHAAPSEKPVKLPDFKPSSAETKAAAALEAAGVSIRPVAQNMNWKEASFRSLGTNATDASIAPLKDVLGLLDLNLAGTKITDAGLVALKGLTNLNVLHLEHTGITDSGLGHLKALVNLEYLNLFNTQVTDAGLKNLSGMARLKNLYVWQTKVTEAGIKEVQTSLPNVKIHTGIDLTAVKKEEKKEEKPAEKK